MQPKPSLVCLGLDVAAGWGFSEGRDFAAGLDFTGCFEIAAGVENPLGKPR